MLYIGSDHGGFELKEKIKGWLLEKGEKVEDLGAYELDESDDYPVVAFKVAEKVANEDDRNKKWEERTKGVLICRSGGGVAIAANRFGKIRAVQVRSEEEAKRARKDDDANVITISGDWTSEEDTKKIIAKWLVEEFSGEERHERRIGMLLKKGC